MVISKLLAALLLILLSAAARAEPILTMFGNAIPQTAVVADAKAVTLGLKFRTTHPGKVLGIRFFRGAASRDGYAVKLFDSNGSLLAAAKAWKETCVVPCWEQVNFASPVPLAPNTTYIAAYYASNGRYAADKYGLTNDHSAGPLTAPASGTARGNGVFTYSTGIPNQTFENSNYYVDIAFTPAASGRRHLIISFNPPNPTIPANAPLGTVVAIISASWNDGTPFAGALGFGPPYSNDGGIFAISGDKLIVNPEGPGVSALTRTTQKVTITATQ